MIFRLRAIRTNLGRGGWGLGWRAAAWKSSKFVGKMRQSWNILGKSPEHQENLGTFFNILGTSSEMCDWKR